MMVAGSFFTGEEGHFTEQSPSDKHRDVLDSPFRSTPRWLDRATERTRVTLTPLLDESFATTEAFRLLLPTEYRVAPRQRHWKRVAAVELLPRDIAAIELVAAAERRSE